MGILIRKQKEFAFTKIARLGIIGLISSFAFAMVSTIWAVYMDNFLKSIVLVGFFSAFLSLASFLFYFASIPLVEKNSKSRLYAFTLFVFAVTYFLFALNNQFYFFVVLAFISIILQTLRITSFGIIIKDKSKKTQLSKNEGLMYTFSNISWVLGPLIAGFLSEKYNLNLVFLLSSIFLLIAFVLFKISKIKDDNIKKKPDTGLLKNFKEFFKSKDRRFAYILGGGVDIWWTLIYIFVPLFIIEEGLEISWVGYFLFAVAIPLIFLEYKFSKITGKVGFKKMFKIGYFIPFIMVFFCFFISNIYIILIFLALAGIGLAILEPATESYFLDILKKGEECRFYGPYNTTANFNYIISRALSALLLVFLPFKFIFLLYSFFMLIFFIMSFKMKDIIEKKK